jgi:two-component system LytT family response regulator
MLKVIIIDDEKRIRSSLKNLIKLHYPNASVIAEAEDLKTAVEAIKSSKPDAVLLDIKMPGGTGFDLIKELMPVQFKIIFITAFDNYAVQAFKFSALDYLLKPVIPQELINALQKAEQEINKEQLNARLNVFMDNISDLARETKKIVLNSHDKMQVVGLNEIVRCEADRNYTKFILTNKNPILVSGSLIEYDEMLSPYGFFRCHHSHLVNLSFIDRFEKREGELIMKDNSKVEVSSRKFSELADALKRI